MLEAVPAERFCLFTRWQWGNPDPTGLQYKCAVGALRTIMSANHWAMKEVWVWCDYHSIPQVNRAMQSSAIKSLPEYASSAHAFVILAPRVPHQDTGLVCDAGSYQKRMWCRAENLFHSFRHGVRSMWLVTTEDDCRLIKDSDSTEMIKEDSKGNQI